MREGARVVMLCHNRDAYDDMYCEPCRNDGYGGFDNDDDDDDSDDNGYQDRDGAYEHDVSVLEVLGLGTPDSRPCSTASRLKSTRRSGAAKPCKRSPSARPFGGIFKRDGSIGNGHSGIELVSAPLSLDEVRLFLGCLFRSNALHPGTFADSTCGMHVHVSRAPLATAQIAKLVRFVHAPRNQHFMEALAGRRLAASPLASIDHRSDSWKAVYDASRCGQARMTDYTATPPSTSSIRIPSSFASRARANVEACAALLALCALAEHRA